LILFNVLFRRKEDHFTGSSSGGKDE